MSWHDHASFAGREPRTNKGLGFTNLQVNAKVT